MTEILQEKKTPSNDNIAKLRTISRAEYQTIFKGFIKKFPNCFSIKEPKPLKIGIHKDLKAALNELGETFTVDKISLFLLLYCGKKDYILSHKVGTIRIDLNGNAAGEVSEVQAKQMLGLLPKPKAKPIS